MLRIVRGLRIRHAPLFDQSHSLKLELACKFPSLHDTPPVPSKHLTRCLWNRVQAKHLARRGDKIEDLRATIEEFGKVGKNLLKEGKIIAPCWIVVTAQEKLDGVVAAIDSKRVELAKLQTASTTVLTSPPP